LCCDRFDTRLDDGALCSFHSGLWYARAHSD
jgi:hypothetical protein